MYPVPEGIEQKLPASSAFMFPAAVAEATEESLYFLRMADLRNALSAGDQRRERARTFLDPFGNRHRESALARECIRRRQRARQPLAQDVFADAVPDLQPIRKAQGELGDHGIKERRAPFETVRHQAAIHLEEKIVRQPVAAIERLRLLE